MIEKIKLGISTCLLGEKVRYDGQHKLNRFLRDELGEFVEWVPVCPEVECGLPIPRESMHLKGTPDSPRLVTAKTGVDHTERMQQWTTKKLDLIAKENLCGYVFKAKSPSSGLHNIKIYDENGMPRFKGRGLFAQAFVDRFPLLPVEDEGRLHDPGLRENFIERVFIYKRWQDMNTENLSMGGLVDFHTRHKYLIMSHSPKHLTQLGRIVSNEDKLPVAQVFEQYIMVLMQAVELKATVKKHVNTLQHIMGYFKKEVSVDEKQELVEVIGNYHNELIPLIVPITLLNHYVRKYDQPYLEKQYYMNPHPIELMLRNHV